MSSWTTHTKKLSEIPIKWDIHAFICKSGTPTHLAVFAVCSHCVFSLWLRITLFSMLRGVVVRRANYENICGVKKRKLRCFLGKENKKTKGKFINLDRRKKKKYCLLRVFYQTIHQLHRQKKPQGIKRHPWHFVICSNVDGLREYYA